MSNKKKRTGRPQKPGRLYRLYIRYRPGIDPPEVKDLLETMVQADHYRRCDIFKAAVSGGVKKAQATAKAVETGATTSLLNDMFAGF